MTIDQKALEAGMVWFARNFNGAPAGRELCTGIITAYLAALPASDHAGLVERLRAFEPYNHVQFGDDGCPVERVPNMAWACSLIDEAASALSDAPTSHQQRVAVWMQECFGAEITADRVERADRFIEEALELAQATGWTADRGHALVDYVFSRPVGEIGQEVGGVMVTLAALCNVFEIAIDAEAKREVDRITQPEIVLKIRAKQAAKPTGSALPVALSDAPVVTEDMVERAAIGIYNEGPSIGQDCECGWAEQTRGYQHKARMIARAALTAALSPQSGEQS